MNIYQNAAAANQLGAEAFTEGNNIHLSSLSANYSETQKKQLLQHELVHVVQQRQNRVSVSNRSELEQEAANPSRYAASLKQPAGKRERQWVRQFRFYEITAEEIEKIRQLLAEGKGMEAYRIVRKNLPVNEALKKFLADYPDIAAGLLKLLDPVKNKSQYRRIARNSTLPVKGLDEKSQQALPVFKAAQNIASLSEIAIRHEVNLAELLVEMDWTQQEAEAHLTDFILAVENNSDVLIGKWKNLANFLSDLQLFALIRSTENQAGIDKFPVNIAENKKYFGYFGAESYLVYPALNIYPSIKKPSRKRKLKKEYGINPTQFSLIHRALGTGKLHFTNMSLADVEQVMHWTGMYVSFDKNAILDEITIDPAKMTMTITAQTLPIDFLKMETSGESGIYADQINLTNAVITLKMERMSPRADGKVKVRAKETSHGTVNFKGNLDIRNLRMVSQDATTGIGSIKIPGLDLSFEQDISERRSFRYGISSSAIAQIFALTAMLTKGPMLLQPLFYGLINLFTVDMKKATDKDWLAANHLATLLNELKGKPHTAKSFEEALVRLPAQEKLANPDFIAFDAHRKNYKAAFADMLSENLKLRLDFEEIKLEHFFMTSTTLTPEQVEQGRLPYIREIAIGKNTTEDNAPEIALETHPLSAEEIEKALFSDLRKELSPAAQAKINAIQQATDKLGAYRLLARESHHSRSKTKDRHKAIVEAAAYFEFFRKTDFAVNSSSGHIKGGNMVADLVLPMMTAMAESSGAKITGLSGIENINYKNLEIGMLQHAQGWEIAPDKFNGLAIEIEVPHATAERLEYHAGGIDLTAKDLDLEELTVGVKLTFNEVMAKEPYELSLSAIKIKKARIDDTEFHYPEMDLHFNSARSVADNITFSMTPTTAPESTDLSIERIGLFEAEVNFGAHEVTSTGDEEVVLEGLAFHQDKERLAFSLGGFGMNGAYKDQTGSHVDFKLNQPKDNGLPFFGYEKQANGNQRIRLRHDGLIQLPVFSFNMAPDQNLEIKNAKIGGIALDLEMEGNDILLHKAAIQTVSGNGYTYTDKDRAVSSDQPITLNELLIENIRITALDESVVSLNNFNWNKGPTYQAEKVKNYAHNYPSETGDPSLLSKDRQLSNQFIGPIDPTQKALISIGSFDLSQLHFNQQNLYINALIRAFRFNQLKAYNLTNSLYGIDEMDKFFAHRELQDFELKGQASYKKRNTEEATANWDFQSKPDEIFTSDYNAETNYTTFENILVGDLWLSQLNFKVGDFHIQSAKNEKRPAFVDNISVGGLRINHSTGELEVDEVRISSISANGLSIKTQIAGWGFESKLDQRASVNDIVLKGWKTKLDNPSAYGPQGKKATLDIGSVIIPKLAGEPSGKEGAAGKVGTSGTIGKIRYTLYKSGAQSLRLKDLSLIGSEYNVSENAEFVTNFLNKVTAKEVLIEIDVHGRKTFLLKDAVISGYQFETNNLEVEADLHCQGDIRLYEGDYEAFVKAMPEALKTGETGQVPPVGAKDAWLIDAAGCKVKLENMRIVHKSWSSGQTAQQKALVETGFYQYQPQVFGGPGLAWNVTPENRAEILNKLKSALRDQGDQKIFDKELKQSEDNRLLHYIHMLDEANGFIMLYLGEGVAVVDINNGMINWDQAKAEFKEMIANALQNVTEDQLPRDERLTSIAIQILTYLEEGSESDAASVFALLGAILGALFGPPGVIVGALIGALLGSLLGGIFAALLKGHFSYLLNLVRVLCYNIIRVENYNDSLNNLLQWVLDHTDVIWDEGKYSIGLIVNAMEDSPQRTLLSTTIPLLELGSPIDNNVQYREKNFRLSGLIKHLYKSNKGPANYAELALLDRIQLAEEQDISADLILQSLYQTPPTPVTDPFAIGGLGGAVFGDGFVSGQDQIAEVVQELTEPALLSSFNTIIGIENLDLNVLAHVLSFDSETRLKFLNPDKTKVNTHIGFNEKGEMADNGLGGRFAMGPVSGFTLEHEKKKALGLGDFQPPHVSLSSSPDKKYNGTTNTEIELKFPASVNGFQLAYRNCEPDKIEKPTYENKGVTHPFSIPWYNNIGKTNPLIMWEFSHLTGIEHTHLIEVNGDFLNAGNDWYDQMRWNEFIRKNSVVGFVRQVDDMENTVDNYLGTMYFSGKRNQVRTFTPFTGKK